MERADTAYTGTFSKLWKTKIITYTCVYKFW